MTWGCIRPGLGWHGGPSTLPGYGGGGLSGMSELVEGVDVVEITDNGEWFQQLRGTGDSERGVEEGV